MTTSAAAFIAIVSFFGFGLRASAATQESDPQFEFQPRADFAGASRYFFDKQNGIIFGGALLTFALAREQDNQAREYFAHRRRIGDLDQLGNDFLGTGVPGALLGLGAWAKGIERHSARLVHFGQANLEAMLATGVVSAGLKGAVRRERPDHGDHYAFPSAHTSTVAATAMTLYEFYGWQAGAPAFFLTALTAVGRMSADKHWLSDTVGGAAIGFLFGHAFSRAHLDRLGSDSLKSQTPASGKSCVASSVAPFGPKTDWVVLPVFNGPGELHFAAYAFF